MSSISSRSVLCRQTSMTCAPLRHLPARDIGGLFPLFRGHQILEEARADHVGALAHQQRPVALLGLHQFDARIVGAMLARGQCARALALDHLRDGADVRAAWCRSSRRRNSASRDRRISPVARPAIPASRRICLRSSAVPRSDSSEMRCADISLSVRMWSVIRSGPVAQFMPTPSRS